MRVALLATIWMALAALAGGEIGRRLDRGAGHRSRAWWLSAAGLLSLVLHMAIAIVHHHGGSHAAAVAETARQTERVYGVAWGGGVYVNYAFAALWAADLWRWRRRSPWRPAARLVLRAFILVIVFNGSVVFATGGRPAGIALTIALLAAWTWPTLPPSPAPS